MGDKEYAEKGIENFENAYGTDDLLHEYLGFSQFIQGCFISEHGYIIDTGNFQTANRRLMHMVRDKINKHPKLWKSLFLIA